MTTPATSRGATLNLTVATIGFLVNFWAWALLGPLGPGLKEKLGLSFAAQSLLVAVPVLVGSLGRIPVGALTDKFGGRVMFPIVSLATIVPVLTLAYVQSSYWAMIVVGLTVSVVVDVAPPEPETEWLKPAQRPLIIVNTASCSGAFIKPLSAANRIIVTSTRSGNEINFAHFGEYMAESIGSLEADLDKDEQTSLLEAFLMASRRVADFYKDEGRLATEHSLIDDNGDGLGTPADWFKGVRAIKKPEKGQADGRRAHQIHLISNAADQRLTAEQRARRDELETQINNLRDRKGKIAKDAYYRELEGLLLQMARLYEESEANK